MAENDVNVRHPRCHCDGVSEIEQTSQTLALANAINLAMSINLGNLDLCNRQGYIALILVIVSSMDSHEYDEQQMRDEVSEAMDVALRLRQIQNNIPVN